MLKLYFHDTPNPRKVALFLEETGTRYKVVGVDIWAGAQQEPAYRAINPNGKVPAIAAGLGGEHVTALAKLYRS